MGRKVTSEDLLAFRLCGEVQVSPLDGSLVYIEKWVEKEKNAYRTAIYQVREGERRRFTFADSDHMPRLSPDGRQLGFLSKRSGQEQVWLMAMEGGEAVQLTSIEGGVAEFCWSPDGKKLGLIANLDVKGVQPEKEAGKEEEDPYLRYTRDVKVITELAHKMDGEGFYEERRPQVCVTAAEAKAAVTQLTSGPYQHHDLSWHSDGSALVVTTRRGADYDRGDRREAVYLLKVTGGEPVMVSEEAMDASAGAVSPDGRLVAYLASDPKEMGYDNVHLFVRELAGGEARELGASLDRPFANEVATDMPAPGGTRPVFTADGRSIHTIVSDHGMVQLVRVDVATGAVTALTQGDHVVYSFGVSADGSRAAVGLSHVLSPGDIYEIEAGGELKLVVELNGELVSELELSRPERFTARAEGGPELDGWLMKPIGHADGKRYPLVLEIHGGPMGMYASTFFFEFQRLAAEGYGVVFGNPRGSQAYGVAFCRAIRGDWGSLDYADLMAVLDAAIEQSPWVDTARLGVLGGSYGGYMTNWIVGHTDRFAAAITMRSVVDWRSMVGSGDGGWMWMDRADDVPPWSADDAWYREQSPITYVENIVTPLLVEHQEGDLRCPIGQGEMLYTAVKWLGKAPVKFIRYPDEFHGMSRTGKPWHRVFRLNSFVEWFATYLG